jgi:hypothetical protein
MANVSLSSKKCSVALCENKYHSKGLCNLHKKRLRANGSLRHKETGVLNKPETIDRFLNKIDFNPSGCWEWKAFIHPDGYGDFRANEISSKRAHVFSYCYFKGELKKGYFVCHTCDNPKCVNPAHLWLGTPKENQHDKIKKGRGNNPSGARHWQAKLSRYQVAKIKMAHLSGIQKAEIAKYFSVSRTTVHDIVLGKSYKSVKQLENTLNRN